MPERRSTPTQEFVRLVSQVTDASEKHLPGFVHGAVLFPELAGYLALEGLAAVAIKIVKLERAGSLPPDKLENGELRADAMVEVPWVFVAAFAAAHTIYDDGKIPFGRAMRLENSVGKRLTKTDAEKFLDEILTAFWIWKHRDDARKAGKKPPLETAKLEVMNDFGLSYHTVARRWKKHQQRARTIYTRVLAEKFPNF